MALILFGKYYHGLVIESENRRI